MIIYIDIDNTRAKEEMICLCFKLFDIFFHLNNTYQNPKQIIEKQKYNH